VDRCRDFLTIAINNAVHLAPWANVLLGGDKKWWDWNDGCSEFTGRKVTASRRAHEAYPYVEFLQPTGMDGFEPNWGKVRTGGNSGYVAIQLAVQLGFLQIVLLGYDFQPSTTGEHHWHAAHPSNAHPNYRSCLRYFDTMIPSLQSIGAEVINCSSHSALRSFPCKSLTDALKSFTKQN
jgi:hypothetical protein